MTFVDEATIEVRAGDGGRGCVAFRREFKVPRGGPSGGDGGNGADVWLIADDRLNTLLKFKYEPLWRAERGRHGEGSNKTGRSGRDLEVTVPVGTVVTAAETGESVADLCAVGQRFKVAAGGRGGRGNARFATSTRQAPKMAEPGEEGEIANLHLTLKLIADVGLVGLPNAGKSSLLARISAARPKVADYPFTTLTPQLGVVRLDDESTLVVADIPGLIEGAHAGHGLGDRFLRHIERTRLLVHVVDIADPEEDVAATFELVRRELDLADCGLLTKPFVIAVNKVDTIGDREALGRRVAPLRRLADVFEISAVTGEGVQALLCSVHARVKELVAV